VAARTRVFVLVGLVAFAAASVAVGGALL